MTAQTVIELRQYRMKPGRRDDLIALFEREFVESQEAHGMSLLGQFRDLDAPGHFVWMRGFESMPARKAALEGFYGGPVWQAHRQAANATLDDNDDVLLLKPPVAAARLDLPPRRPDGADLGPASLIGLAIQALDGPPPADLAARFEGEVRPALEAAGAAVLGWMVTEAAENSFPRLPVREGEPVLVWIGRFADAEAHAEHLVRAERAGLGDGFGLASKRGVIQRLRLAPTARSRLR
ncbi:NIPSNAP family protein [Caulobacter sp. UNC279MFTsu5.1]|uniref:NIPSNAP family protein n=1 Tax=Caulobacter sp. UNC279MFTsu5.1 TaxID=1502775 RepID=UPI0008EF0A2C|nr:NIPSNAP family protein [Caulobacter sp. UNC279MFTsu5.1]SFK44036.1 NIPSNAP protein [Caulobacter sp. UNC279MFTsu5.1]